MNDVEQRVQIIPVRQRDTRTVGCTGDAQIIISNSDLEDLIVSVLEACNSSVDVLVPVHLTAGALKPQPKSLTLTGIF
jgi:hypothetical protein